MATKIDASANAMITKAIEAVDCIVPEVFSPGTLQVASAPVEQSEIGVLIGITGELKARLFVSATLETFGAVGKLMYQMELVGELALSFAAEFTNMVAGHLVRLAYPLSIDISPPTTLEGGSRLYGFAEAWTVPLHSPSMGTMYLSWMVDDRT